MMLNLLCNNVDTQSNVLLDSTVQYRLEIESTDSISTTGIEHALFFCDILMRNDSHHFNHSNILASSTAAGKAFDQRNDFLCWIYFIEFLFPFLFILSLCSAALLLLLCSAALLLLLSLLLLCC